MEGKDRCAVGLAEAKDKLSSLTAKANETGEPFVILKNNKPWVEVRPVATQTAQTSADRITVTPAKRNLEVVDLDDLFSGYDGSFEISEDGFSDPVGEERM